MIRGEDHVSNTPKHILLFEALGHPIPVFGHLPLILNPDGTKMSKRKSQTAVADYIAPGLHPRGLDQLLRVPRLVARAPRRTSSRSTSIEQRFDIDKVQKGGARFDRDRLEWLNGQWIRRLEPDDLVDRLRPFLQAAVDDGRIDRVPTDDEVRALLPIVQERLPTLAAIVDLVGFLWARRRSTSTRRSSCPSAGTPRRRVDGLTAAARAPRRPRRGDLGGRRARAAAPRARRGPRLEGRRPVHGDPRRDDRPDRDAAAVRHARRARAAERTLGARSTRRSPARRPRRNMNGSLTPTVAPALR